MKESKERLYQILDELFDVDQSLKSFEYVLDNLQEAYPVSGAAEIRAIIDCSRTYIVAVERQLSEQLDRLDEILTEI